MGMKVAKQKTGFFSPVVEITTRRALMQEYLMGNGRKCQLVVDFNL
jgi:hypothetical protein